MNDSLALMETQARWLAEARAVIADIAHHDETTLWLALRVAMAHSNDPAERREASELHRLIFSAVAAA